MILTLNPQDCTVNIDKKVITIANNIGGKHSTFITKLESEAMKLKQLVDNKPRLQEYVKESFREIVKVWKREGAKKNSFALLLAVTPVIPPELIEIILTIIAVLAAVGVGGAMIGFMLAGVWKMAFGKAKADEWTLNIIKGLVQVLAAPVIVALLVSVFVLLFSHLAAFKTILEPISIFFHQ